MDFAKRTDRNPTGAANSNLSSTSVGNAYMHSAVYWVGFQGTDISVPYETLSLRTGFAMTKQVVLCTT